MPACTLSEPIIAVSGDAARETRSYVGAAGSDDSFDAGETGAEARSQDG